MVDWTAEEDSVEIEDEEAGSVEGAADSELTATRLGGPTSAMMSNAETVASGRRCGSEAFDSRSRGRSRSCRLTCLALVPLVGPFLDLKCPFPMPCPIAWPTCRKASASRSKGSIENG